MVVHLSPIVAAVFATTGFLAVSAAVPGPHMAPVPDQAAAQAWSARLDQGFSPMMADCVRLDVASHVEPADLDAMLARAAGDPRLYPRFGAIVDRATARCRLQQLVVEN